jgi:hypothetical protein
MENHDTRKRQRAPLVYLLDAAYALAAMGIVYQLGGTSALVILVYAYSVSVVIFLLILVALSYWDLHDNDLF